MASIGIGLGAPTLAHLVIVETAAAAAFALATALDVRWTTACAVVVPLAVLPFVVIAGRSVRDWAITTVRYLIGATPPLGVTVEHVDSGGREVGVHRRHHAVSCVLELIPISGVTTRLGRGGAVTESSIDLTDLTRCLTQHEIELSEIAVISHGMRSASGSPTTDVYERLIGPLPAVATRSVWVTVSLDVRANRTALDARGGGHVGACRTITIATDRVARALEAQGISSHILSRAQIQSAASPLCRGVPRADLTENWRSAPLPGVVRTGFALDCRGIDDETLAEIWAEPALSTTVAVHLSPSSAEGRVVLRGACGFVTRTTRPAPALRSLIPMHGRQRESLLSTLPLPIAPGARSGPKRTLSLESIAALHVPSMGCGQLLGSDASGHGVAARIHGPGIRSVHVAGELYLAQQLVFRAVATGAYVVIRTDRPHGWGPLLDSVATPDRLAIDRGAYRSGSRPDLVVHDFSDPVDIPDRPRNDGVTVLTLTEHPPRTPMPDPDLSIVQPGAVGDLVHVRSRQQHVDLTLVTIPQETAFIGRPRSLRQPTGAY